MEFYMCQFPLNTHIQAETLVEYNRSEAHNLYTCVPLCIAKSKHGCSALLCADCELCWRL